MACYPPFILQYKYGSIIDCYWTWAILSNCYFPLWLKCFVIYCELCVQYIPGSLKMFLGGPLQWKLFQCLYYFVLLFWWMLTLLNIPLFSGLYINRTVLATLWKPGNFHSIRHVTSSPQFWEDIKQKSLWSANRIVTIQFTFCLPSAPVFWCTRQPGGLGVISKASILI